MEIHQLRCTVLKLFHQPTLMHNCALNLVDEVILYYDARSKKLQSFEVVHTVHLINISCFSTNLLNAQFCS